MAQKLSVDTVVFGRDCETGERLVLQRKCSRSLVIAFLLALLLLVAVSFSLLYRDRLRHALDSEPDCRVRALGDTDRHRPPADDVADSLWEDSQAEKNDTDQWLFNRKVINPRNVQRVPLIFLRDRDRPKKSS